MTSSVDNSSDVAAFSGRQWAGSAAEQRNVLSAAEDVLQAPFLAMAQGVVGALLAGNKILFCGNGGSAADAQHLAAELTVRYLSDRRALPAIALASDSSAMSACGNDFGFERIFARQVEALGNPGDVLVAISTSGSSPNVVAALAEARGRGLSTVLLTGARGAGSKDADHVLAVPSSVTARIQETHIWIGHTLCDVIESVFRTVS